MSKLEVDAIEPQSGTTITIGASGDTVNLVGTLQSNGSPLPGDISSVVAGTGLSGGGTTGAVTLNIEAAQPTITSLGTLTALNVAGAATVTVSDNSTALEIISTDADADVGPRLSLYRNSASPADNDILGDIRFMAEDDASAKLEFAKIEAKALDVSSGSRDTQLRFQIRHADSGNDILKLTPTEAVFNDGSFDTNFRVESNNNANAFFVDAGNDSVGIGTSSPDAKLDVATGSSGAIFRYDTASTFLQILPEDANGDVSLRFRANSGSAPDLLFKSDNGSEVIRIGNNGNVGIGETAPLGKLHVKTSDVGASVHANADELVLENNGNTGITIASSDTATGAIYFADSSNQFDSWIQYTHSNRALQFASAGQERMRIDSSGNVGIGTSSPSTSLHISQSQPIITLTDTDTSVSHQLSGQSSSSHFNLKVDTGGSSGSPVFNLSMQDSIKLSVLNSGNVGIGTTSPSQPLDVLGSAQISFSSGVNTYQYFQSTSNFIGRKTDGNLNIGVAGSQSIVSSVGGSEKMRIDSNGHVGIGTSSPGTYNLNIQDSSDGCRVLLRGGSGQGTFQEFDVDGGTTIGYIGDAANLVSGGSQTDLAMRATNNIEFSIGLTEKAKISSSGLNVSGALSKSSGSFKIDHPLENKKDTHYLVHSFVEAPQADNIYRGKTDLVSGTATVNIDTVAGMSEGTFVLLNREIQCFTSNETGWTAVKGSVSGNTLTITAQDNSCDDTISWMVIGERQDQHMYDTDWTDENGKVIVELLKETETETTTP